MDNLLGSLLAGVVGGLVVLLFQGASRRVRAAGGARSIASRAKDHVAKRRFIIKLTKEQQEELKIATGIEAETLAYSESELEARKAPKLERHKHLHGLWVALGLDD